MSDEPTDVVEPAPPAPAGGTRSGLSMARVAGGVAAFGGLLLVAGALLPWISGADASQVVHGITVNEDGFGVVGNRAGAAGGDGLVLIAAGIGAVVIGVLLGIGRQRRSHARWLLIAGVGAAAWTFVDLAEVGDVARPDGSTLDLSPGIGPFVAMFGVVAILAAALLAVLFADVYVRADSALASRLHRRDREADSIDVSQRAWRRNRMLGRRWRDGAIVATVDLMTPQSWVEPDRFERNVPLVESLVEELRGLAPEDLDQQRLQVGLMLGTIDPGRGLAYLDRVEQAARTDLANDPDRLAVVESGLHEVRSLIGR